MEIKPGEVYQIDLGYAGKVRKMVVVSRYDPDAPRALVLCAPITTKFRDSKYEVFIGKPYFLQETSYVNTQGIVAIQYHELIKKAGELDSKTFLKIKEAIKYTFDL